jgi:hypothetical protein
MLAYLLALPYLLALLRFYGWLIVYHGISIISRYIYHLSLANRPRFFAIILILILLHILLLFIFLLSIFLLIIVTIPFHIHIAVQINAVRCVHIILHPHIPIRVKF